MALLSGGFISGPIKRIPNEIVVLLLYSSVLFSLCDREEEEHQLFVEHTLGERQEEEEPVGKG